MKGRQPALWRNAEYTLGHYLGTPGLSAFAAASRRRTRTSPSPFTDAQRKMIMDVLPEWQQDSKQDRRTQLLADLFRKLVGNDEEELAEDLQKVGTMLYPSGITHLM